MYWFSVRFEREAGRLTGLGEVRDAHGSNVALDLSPLVGREVLDIAGHCARKGG